MIKQVTHLLRPVQGLHHPARLYQAHLSPKSQLHPVVIQLSHSKKSSVPIQTRRSDRQEAGGSQQSYDLFVDLIYKMLAFDPEDRISPDEALNHPFIRSGEQSEVLHLIQDL
jgi:serine/threonine protein kinase